MFGYKALCFAGRKETKLLDIWVQGSVQEPCWIARIMHGFESLLNTLGFCCRCEHSSVVVNSGCSMTLFMQAGNYQKARQVNKVV